MKTLITSLFIIIFVFTVTGMSEFNNDNFHLSDECPEQEPFDWVAVDLFLTSTQHQQNREKASIGNMKKQDVEFKKVLAKYLDGEPRTKDEVTKYWNALGKYWQNNGIIPLTNSETCQAINNKLSSEIFVQRHQEAFNPRAFYQINDKYLIIHKSTERNTRPKSALILDKNLNILVAFGI